MPETRMNTASPCCSGSLCIWPFQFTLGNGMEEVVGSIPTRSTKFGPDVGRFEALRRQRAPACRGGRRFDPDQVHQAIQ